MRFTALPLEGAYVVDTTPLEDERGFFARTFCADEFAAHGLRAPCSQSSVSYNTRRGTLRGLHFQAPPHAEDKLVRCTSGAIFDVIVDVRDESPTRFGWFGAELTGRNGRALYIPRGFAHGFITLADDSEVLYMMSVAFVPGFDRGLRWDDPALGIDWPLRPRVIAARDAEYPHIDRSARRDGSQ